MEFSICDLLDGFPEEFVDIQTIDLASSHRVKELTMQKIHKQTKHRRFSGRRLTFLVAAVILVMSLAITASADTLGIAQWFRGIFRDLSPEQEQIVESMAMEQDQFSPVSQTVNGTTVTLVSAIGDGYNCYARLRFEAPAGTDLSRENLNDYYIYNAEYALDESNPNILSRPADSMAGLFSYSFTWEDTTVGDNVLEAVLRIVLEEDCDIRFDDDIPEKLTIPYLMHEWEQILEGPWQLELTALGGQSKNLDVQGKTTVHKTYDCETEIQLNRVTVTQLGIEVDASFAEPLTGQSNFTYPTASAVLMDGTIAPAHLADQYAMNQLTSEKCHYRLYFDAPLELKDIDHIRFGDLILPVSGDGSVQTGEDLPEYTVGTHVTLGDPASLRLSAKVRDSGFDFADMTSRQWNGLSVDDKLAASSYAEYTDEGIRMYRWSSTFGAGRLAFTITGARVVTNMAELDGSYAGFEREAFLKWTEMEEPDPEYPQLTHEWVEQEIPVGINPDGSFQEGSFLVLVDMVLENQGVSIPENYWSPNQSSPYEFNTTGLPFFANVADKDVGNFRYVNANYFTDEDGGWRNYVEVLPGESKKVTSGFYCSAENFHGGNWTIENLRACNTSGSENSVFIDLDLD